MKNEIPRHVAMFPISVVKEMTNLTARQIRYYEEQGLITPERNEGNQRLFSLNDIARFMEIKSYIDEGVNIAGIKAVFASKQQKKNTSAEKAGIDMTSREWQRVMDRLVAKKGNRST
ncbi:MerR family transcriptional regulator [Halalkalibacterium ligniniphilum]|uniref:MerR family transcriptional regulator n=1 Tax=Halalkalibacterium ligniniphilum TaxID=1134413 RepID=UPI0003483E0E|nr:MerR family transcriptional regulator [Halalkalibacterium ligniniphilum]